MQPVSGLEVAALFPGVGAIAHDGAAPHVCIHWSEARAKAAWATADKPGPKASHRKTLISYPPQRRQPRCPSRAGVHATTPRLTESDFRDHDGN